MEEAGGSNPPQPIAAKRGTGHLQPFSSRIRFSEVVSDARAAAPDVAELPAPGCRFRGGRSPSGPAGLPRTRRGCVSTVTRPVDCLACRHESECCYRCPEYGGDPVGDETATEGVTDDGPPAARGVLPVWSGRSRRRCRGPPLSDRPLPDGGRVPMVECERGATLAPVLMTRDNVGDRHRCPECRRRWECCPSGFTWPLPFAHWNHRSGGPRRATRTRGSPPRGSRSPVRPRSPGSGRALP